MRKRTIKSPLNPRPSSIPLDKIKEAVKKAPPKRAGIVCPECFGKTILFRGKGLDIEYYLCSHWKEFGHLTEEKIKKRYQSVFKPIWEQHGGRFA